MLKKIKALSNEFEFVGEGGIDERDMRQRLGKIAHGEGGCRREAAQ